MTWTIQFTADAKAVKQAVAAQVVDDGAVNHPTFLPLTMLLLMLISIFRLFLSDVP
jgi:hypothetical protein